MNQQKTEQWNRQIGALKSIPNLAMMNSTQAAELATELTSSIIYLNLFRNSLYSKSYAPATRAGRAQIVKWLYLGPTKRLNLSTYQSNYMPIKNSPKYTSP